VILINNSGIIGKILENKIIYIDNEKIIYKDNKLHDEFLDDLAHYESSGRYDAYKSAGDYWGRYQFGPIARKEVGVTITIDQFMSNKSLQDGYVVALMQKNKDYLKTHIGKYEGKTIKGIYITQSGILAASHLRGQDAVRQFLDSNGNTDMSDGNGTKVSKYMDKLSGYKLDL